jgi:DNA topoisomerase-1
VSKKVVESESEEEDEDGEENGKIKWSKLEHHGVLFCPPYKPHGVPINHNGKPMVLTPEQEEVCNYWASVIGSEFAEKELVKKNFEKTLLDMIDPKLGVKRLEDLDFAPIKAHLERMREERKNRPLDERKREAEEKLKAEAKYKYCLFDGQLEKVSNCLVEPPSIFRGRGDHPHAGKIK